MARRCPLCDEPTRIRWLFRANGYAIVRCQSCGLQYVGDPPSPPALAALYDATFFDVGQKFTVNRAGAGFINAAARVERILDLPDTGRQRWLDVGCATGDFLAAAAPYVSETSGVELSPFAAERASARGLTVSCGDFLETDIALAAFDVISMWDYIEHVVDPVATLRKASTLLRAGGYLCLSTGDAESPAARVMGRFWHLMIPPKHLSFFSARTIDRLLRETGFAPVRLDRPGKRIPVDFALWKLATMVLPPVAPAVLRVATGIGLGRISPSINLLDIMTVHARKR